MNCCPRDPNGADIRLYSQATAVVCCSCRPRHCDDIGDPLSLARMGGDREYRFLREH